MVWEYLWLKLAIGTGVEPVVWPVATSKEIAWSSGDARFRFEPSGHFATGDVERPAPHEEPLLMQVWGDCLDALGGEGWDLVAVAPLSAEARLTWLGSQPRGAGRPSHDMQLWIFKRARSEHAAAGPARR